MLLMLKELNAVNGVDPDETSSAHPINSRALLSSEAPEAPVAASESGQFNPSVPSRPGSAASSLNAGGVALSEFLQRERTEAAAEPAKPFVGINPATLPAAAAAPPTVFPAPAFQPPVLKDPSPPPLVGSSAVLAGPPPQAPPPPLLPPSGIAPGGTRSSVVVSLCLCESDKRNLSKVGL